MAGRGAWPLVTAGSLRNREVTSRTPRSGGREGVRGQIARRMVVDLSGDGLFVAAETIMEGRSSTMAGRGDCPLLEDGTGLRRRGYHGRELQGLE